MSDGESYRPRRAVLPEGDGDESIPLDDTPARQGSPARRGASGEPDAEPSNPVDRPSPTAPETSPAERGSATTHSPKPQAQQQPAPANPFARPGSDAPLPPVDTPIPAPVFPRSAGEFSESPSPAPRRSALSSATPPEAPAAPAASTPEAATASGEPSWLEAHRPKLLKWAIGGVVGALVVALLTFLVVRSLRPGQEPGASPTPTSASPSPSVEPATADDLLTPGDLSGVSPSTWTVTGTTYAASEHQARGACLSTEATGANPVVSLQRTLATSDADQSAALHRIDVYANERAAQQVFDSRVSALSNCSEVPTLIVGANTVTGLTDQTFQITVVFQDEKAQYHTVLLTRAGSALQLLDVTRVGEQVAAASVPTALVRSQTALSSRQGATAPTEIAVADATVPVAEPAGWLVPSDLPRIRAGFGRWSLSDPGQVDGQMGCENMTLASEPGPTSREQTTSVMTQDDQAPETFGMDQMRFVFGDGDASAAFAKKLSDSLASCKDRVNTATVTEHEAVTGTAGELATSSRIFTINQATSATESLTYQLIVSVAGTNASYTLITVTDDYRFSDEQLTQLALRAGVRDSQIP